MASDKANFALHFPRQMTSGEDKAEKALDQASQKRIGDQLKAMYDEVLHQPVPSRLSDLLAALDGKDAPEDGPRDKDDPQEKGSTAGKRRG